jgi:hypothetical protein
MAITKRRNFPSLSKPKKRGMIRQAAIIALARHPSN